MKMTDEKKLIGFKMSNTKKMIIKRRAATKGVDMKVIFNEMIDKYFDENPMTKEELSEVNSSVAN